MSRNVSASWSFASRKLMKPGPATAIDAVVGQPLGDEGPEPVMDPGECPAGRIDVRGGTGAQRRAQGVGLDLQPSSHALQGLGQGALGDGEMGALLEAGADLIEGQAVDVLQQEGLGQDLGAQGAVGHLVRRIRRGDHGSTASTVVASALEAGDLDPRRDEVCLEMRGHRDGRPQRAVTLRTPRPPLFHDAIDGRGGRTGHPRVAGLLAGPLEAMQEGRQTKGLTLRRVEPVGEPLDVLLEARDPTLLLVDERDEVWFRQPLEIGNDGQRPSLSPGTTGTL